jgi:hypothetical protein
MASSINDRNKNKRSVEPKNNFIQPNHILPSCNLASVMDKSHKNQKKVLSQRELLLQHFDGIQNSDFLPHKTKLHKSTKTLNFLRKLKTRQSMLTHVQSLQANICAFTTQNTTNTVKFDTDSVEIIIDTGATAAFSHCINDFKTFTCLKSKVNGLGSLTIKGVGTIEYPVINDNNERVILSIRNAYYVPDLQTRLISPQQICKQNKTPCTFSGDGQSFKLQWGSHTKTVDINQTNNLPTLYTAPGMDLGHSIVANMAASKGPYCFRAAPRTIPVHKFLPSLEDSESDDEATIDKNGDNDTIKQKTIKVNCSTSKCNDCKKYQVSTDTDTNIDISSLTTLSPLQTEYLHLHERMGHPNFGTMQKWSRLGLIPNKFKNVKPPMCLSCQLGKQHKVRRDIHNKIISSSVKKPGDLIHMDQAETNTPGRPMTLSGKNNQEKIKCFTLFVDSISKQIFAEFQTSTEASQTIAGKSRFEKHAMQYDVKLKNFRADNGIFRSKEFMDDIRKHNQDIIFCGVGAHHQNGVAERHIHTIVERARTNLLHASTKWPDAIDSELWTFAVNYSIEQWNNTPRDSLNNLTPEEVFTGVTLRHLPSNKENIDKVTDVSKSFHTFGCPVYVLQSELQDGGSLPKFDPCSRTGIFLGHSSDHASNVALVLNPTTGHISNQYHVLFDNNFETIAKSTSSAKFELWDNISKSVSR